MSDSQEKLQNSPDRSVEIAQQPVVKQTVELNKGLEASAELSPRDIEAQAERTRIEAMKTAVDIKDSNKKIQKAKDRSASSKRGLINKKQRDESYKRTMKRVQNELPASSGTFSKIIHNKVIEKTSDVIASTIARPNAILFGAIFAFILPLLTYTLSKTIGYALSGFETILAYLVGWIHGITYDYLRITITGKKS